MVSPDKCGKVTRKIAVLGSKMVGQALSEKLVEVGHSVVIGTRNPEKTKASTETSQLDPVSFSEWYKNHSTIEVATFADATKSADIIINATGGVHTMSALGLAGAENIGDKVLINVALPLDMSQGFPPTLLMANTDSLGETIQREFPQAKVVETLNTVFKEQMVEPAIYGETTMFISGEDEAAKNLVITEILQKFGWAESQILDLGGIVNARGTEMSMRLYFQLAAKLGTFEFSFVDVKNK